MSGATSSPYPTPTTAPTRWLCRRVLIPDDLSFIAAVNDVLSRLGFPEMWEPTGISAEDAAAMMTEMFQEYIQGGCMIGTIMPYASADAPRGTLPCDGSTHARQDFPRLYEALDPAFRVNADSFVVPDLRGRFLFGAQSGNPVASVGGAATHTLTTSEMPAHSHTTIPHDHSTLPHEHGEGVALPSVASVLPPPDIIPSAIPGISINMPATVSVLPSGVTVNDAGGGQAHNNMPPYLALNYCIVAA